MYAIHYLAILELKEMSKERNFIEKNGSRILEDGMTFTIFYIDIIVNHIPIKLRFIKPSKIRH